VGRKGGRSHAHLRRLAELTDEGISTVKETIQRADSAAELAQQHGGNLQVYWTVGSYDLVGILEAPDDESATAFLLKIGMRGHVRTTTLRAYDREQMSGIIERLG
jgi:uncharacterized protein with GYD domain